MEAGADEALMLDDRGFVATCNSTHFFIVRNGELWTSAGGYCLGGITRDAVLRAARRAGIPAYEKDFSLFDVYAADEAFCTGTFAGLTPVVKVDGRADRRISARRRRRLGADDEERCARSTRRSRPRKRAADDATDRTPLRVAMWSGPRNVSTAMMRAFGDPRRLRGQRRAVLRRLSRRDRPRPPDARSGDRLAADRLARGRRSAMLGPVPGGKAVWYQKHMTHHMLPDFGRDWIDGLQSTPSSSARRRRCSPPTRASGPARFGLDEIGLPAQVDLFERAADRLGRAPPVIDGRDVLADPRGALGALCAALRHRLRRCDARLAAGTARQRRGLGAGLVRRGRELDRLRAARRRAGIRRPARFAESHRRGRATALRASGAPQARGRMTAREAAKAGAALKASG